MENNNEVREISKIRIENIDYDIKDVELREMIAKFRGDLKEETEERKKRDGLEK